METNQNEIPQVARNLNDMFAELIAGQTGVTPAEEAKFISQHPGIDEDSIESAVRYKRNGKFVSFFGTLFLLVIAVWTAIACYQSIVVIIGLIKP